LQDGFDWQALSIEYRFTTQFLSTVGTLAANSPVITAVGDTTGLDSTYQIAAQGVNNDTYVLTVDSATQVTMSQVASAAGTVSINFCKTKYAMPPDFSRVVNRTQWDKSRHWEMIGPETPQQWQWLKSGYIATGPRIRWRQVGGYFQIWPAVASPEYLGMEYVSNYAARAVDGTPKQYFTLDTDTCIFPDGLMILGLKMLYQRAKGLGMDYVDDFEMRLSTAKAHDAGAATLSMAPRLNSTLIGWENIPDSGYGM
jgi:hypothetical protein